MKKTLSFLLLYKILGLFLIQSVSAQNENTLQSTRKMGEADFHFDVFYKIVDCGDGIPKIFLTTFNESGQNRNVAFDILLKDDKGEIQNIRVSYFFSKLGELITPTCSNDDTSFLIFSLSPNLNWKAMTTSIKFYTK